MKKPILALLWLLLALILPACAPYMTYDDLEAEALITGDRTRVEKYEKRVEKAALFFQAKHECLVVQELHWICPRGPASKDPRRGHERSMTELLRDHRQERGSMCGCASERQMRDFLRRAMSGY